MTHITAQQLALISLPFTSIGWLCCLLLVVSLTRNVISDYLDTLVGIAANPMPFVVSHQVQGYAWAIVGSRRGVVGYRFNVEVRL